MHTNIVSQTENTHRGSSSLRGESLGYIRKGINSNPEYAKTKQQEWNEFWFWARSDPKYFRSFEKNVKHFLHRKSSIFAKKINKLYKESVKKFAEKEYGLSLL